MKKYWIRIATEDNIQTDLDLYIEPRIVDKPHFRGRVNSYGHSYRIRGREPVFIEDGLTDELKGVTVESLKKFEESYFKPQYEIIKVGEY